MIVRKFFLPGIFLSLAIAGTLLLKPSVRAETTPNLFFSEYIEGSSYNKALEIFNPTGSTVDLSEYKIEEYANANTSPSYTRSLAGLLVAGDVYVLCNNQNSPKPLTDTGQCDLLLGGSILSFNGNDSLVLALADGTPVDVFGQIGSNPLVEWGNGIISTADHILVRKCNIISGDINGSDFFNPAIEWDGYSIDTFSYLGFHTLCLPSPTPTPSPEPSPSPTPLPPSPTLTPSPETTLTPTPTLEPTLTPTPTIEIILTPTPSPTLTPTPTAEPTPSLTPTPYITLNPTQTLSPTPTPPHGDKKETFVIRFENLALRFLDFFRNHEFKFWWNNKHLYFLR